MCPPGRFVICDLRFGIWDLGFGIYERGASPGTPGVIRGRTRCRARDAPYLSGSVKTYSALPFSGWWMSGAIVRGTCLGLPPPRPVGTAMYCLPAMLNEIGKP